MCKDPKSYQIPSTEEEYIKQSSKSPTKYKIKLMVHRTAHIKLTTE